ncbi:unnamed protein product [Cladocopium goreaui]|uniref:Biotin protein ligase C-terminal domain-containing protein n=1 Tax=Cladocopium goreaui TaxID=2562237 RepID=A0A9P1C7I6_9DINO|nr:unnamed protein product [Cladocopium goreaui]
MQDFVFFPVKPVKVSVPSAQRGELIPVLLPVIICLLFMVFLRTCRRRRAAQGNGRARGTLLTSLRVSKRAQDGKKVATAVLKPIERAMQPWIDGPRSVEYDLNIFTVGGRVTDVCGTKATIVGVDEDGDLPVFTDDGKTMIFYAKNCRKAISVGDRVFNTRREEVAEVIGFDHMGAHPFVGTWGPDDPVVVKPNQLRSAWPRCVIERLTSIGDRVHLCETMGTVEGFDEDGDFKVKMSNGQPVVWYAHKCLAPSGPVVVKDCRSEIERGRAGSCGFFTMDFEGTKRIEKLYHHITNLS